MRLKDKVAIVTGGSAGIGKAIAQDLAKEGAKVVVIGRRVANCELKDLAYESARRWVRIFAKEREVGTGQEKEETLELIEVKPPRMVPVIKGTGVRLKVGLVDILVEKDFDGSVLAEVLKVLEAV